MRFGRLQLHRSVGGRFSGNRVGGFTLIEMIAAFVVFAIAVGSLMQILTISMNNARYSRDETRAALLAQSKLDLVGVGERLEAGHTRGDFGNGYSWEMEVGQIDPAGIEPPAPVGGAIAGLGPNQQVAAAQQIGNSGAMEVSPVEIYQVDLTMHWGGRDRPTTAIFSTLRSANPDPENMGGASIKMPSRSTPASSGRQ